MEPVAPDDWMAVGLTASFFISGCMPDRRRWFELEQEKLKEKLDEELHSIARPLEELAPGDSYFVKIQGILAIKTNWKTSL